MNEKNEAAMMIKNLLTKTFITIITLSINLLFANLNQTVDFDSTDVDNTTNQVITLSNTGTALMLGTRKTGLN